MKTIITTAVLLAAFSAPSFAETTGTDALGSDRGSIRLSQQDPVWAGHQFLMAQKVKVSAHSYGTYARRG